MTEDSYYTMTDNSGLLTDTCIMLTVLPSPRPWDFPPSIDGDISHADDPMELDDPE
jgi:hypothetical protein